jgi:two-component system NarL family sensor kinase
MSELERVAESTATAFRRTGHSFAAVADAVKEPEQLVVAFFNTPTVGLGICDDELRYQAINDALATMNGVPAEAHLGRTVREILPDVAEEIERPLRRVLATGEPTVNLELSLQLRTRAEVGHWIGNYFPLLDRAGRVKQVGFIVVEVTTQKNLEESLRNLARKLLRTRDEEQRRIARALHDSINQYHAALGMSLDRLGRADCTPALRAALLAQSADLVDACISETRTMSHLLHPPLLDETGFASATEWFVNGFAQRSGIRVVLNLPSRLQRLPGSVEIALFRVLQEALTNVHRHARASVVNVDIERTRKYVALTVRDDGCGIRPKRLRQLRETPLGGGVGLASMRERVHELRGLFSIQSDERGTAVSVKIPVPSGREESSSSPGPREKGRSAGAAS